MTATLNGRLQLSMSVSYQSALDNQNANADLARAIAADLANGTGSGKADLMFSDLRSLSSGANESLDLVASLVDAFGATLTFAKVKALIIESPATNTVNITVGGDGTAPIDSIFGDTTDTIVIQPGGFLALVAPQTGYAVTATTADKLKVLAGAAAVDYRIHIIGASA